MHKGLPSALKIPQRHPRNDKHGPAPERARNRTGSTPDEPFSSRLLPPGAPMRPELSRLPQPGSAPAALSPPVAARTPDGN